MEQSSFSLKVLAARLFKLAIIVCLLPVAIGLLTSLLGQLERISSSGFTYRSWIEWGFLTYVGIHLLLYRPVGLFRFSHRLFSVLAVWLFGAQVATVQEPSGGKGGGKKNETPDPAGQGSTLVAFSPYVVPLYMVLVCAIGYALRRWWAATFIDAPISFLIGFTLAFHWIMTADDLQQQRKRWHVETYLLALVLVFVLTLLIAAACFPWAIPEFSFIQTLAEGLSNAQAINAAVVGHLFF